MDLDRGISILANLGVIAGIVFLGIELRQNNELMAEQQRFNRLTVANSSQELVIAHPHLAELLVKVESDPGQLTPAERRQMAALGRRVVDVLEWTFRELSRQELPVERWRLISSGEGWREIVWEPNRTALDSDFVLWMEENVLDQ